MFWWQAINNQSNPAATFPEPPQWVGTPMSYPIDVWGPCPPSAVPPGGGNSQGTSPPGESLLMSLIQIEVLHAPLPHKISPLFSYPLPPSSKYSPVLPTFPAPAVDFVSPLANCIWRTTTFVPSTWTKELPSVVLHKPRRPSPSISPSLQQPDSIASSMTVAGTFMMSDAPNCSG